MVIQPLLTLPTPAQHLSSLGTHLPGDWHKQSGGGGAGMVEVGN